MTYKEPEKYNTHFDVSVDPFIAAGISVSVQVQNLSSLWFFADTAGNGIAWLKK
jgi:hypothetical protein